MRVVAMVVLSCLAACASEKLALMPPAGVDFSGHWRLNLADSDDPQRLQQGAGAHPSSDSDDRGRRGGRGERGGSGAAPGVTPIPSVPALGEAMAWPGPEILIRQNTGVVTFTTNGVNRVYRPSPLDKPKRRRDAEDDPAHGRDVPIRARGEAPPLCGWDDRTLVVVADDPDEGRSPFERRFSLSEDGRRLVEVVTYALEIGSEFTLSLVWDRVGP